MSIRQRRIVMCMSGTSATTSLTEPVSSLRRMDRLTKGCSQIVRLLGRENIHSRMVEYTSAISLKDNAMEMESTLGQTKAAMKGTG